MTSNTGMTAGRPSARASASTAAALTNILGGQEETVRVNFDLPKSKHRALKAYAVESDKTIKEIFEEYVDSLTSR